LLSQGGSGVNDLGNSYNVVGIGIAKAANIVWNAESTGRLQPQSQYIDARTAMIEAARALNNGIIGSSDEISVTDAWYAVGVGPYISGSDIAPCSVNTSYSVSTDVTSVTWNIPSNLQIISGQGTNTIVVRPVASGTSQGAVIQLTGTFRGETLKLSKTISVGCRYITSLTASSTSVSPGSNVTFTAYPTFPASEGDYEWMVSPTTGASQSPWRNTNYITFSGGSSSYVVGVRAISSCTTPGSWTTTYIGVSSLSAPISFTASVDPSNSVVVSFDSGTPEESGISAASASLSTKQMQTYNWQLLYAITGALAASGQIASIGGVLNFSNLPTGVYLLKIDMDNNGTPATQKIILK